MAYVTNGSTHKNGVILEKLVTEVAREMFNDGDDIFNFKNDMLNKFGKTYKTTFEHKGGTKQKMDAVVYCIGKNGIELCKTISIKHKKFSSKNKPVGTNDLINKSFNGFAELVKKSTQNTYNIDSIWVDMKKTLNKYKKIVKTKDDVNRVKPIYNKELCKQFQKLIPCIKQINDVIINEFKSTDWLAIAKTKEIGGKMYFTDLYVGESKLLIKELFPKRNYYIKASKNRASGRICYRDKNNQEIQSPFRVRLTLNNGLSAYYGKSDKNKNSYLSMKVQMDGVPKLLGMMNEYSIKKKIVK